MNKRDLRTNALVEPNLLVKAQALVIPSAARNLLCSAARVLWAALREIFDESPYARFLARNGVVSSGAAYAAFVQEKSGDRPRPRCC